MTELEREWNRLFRIVSGDECMFYAWRRYSHIHRNDIPLHNGSAIQRAANAQMREFIIWYG